MGQVARRGVVPRRRLGRLRLAARFPWARFGGGGGAVLAGLSEARGATYTGGAPAAVGRYCPPVPLCTKLAKTNVHLGTSNVSPGTFWFCVPRLEIFFNFF